jgi:DMSO/TMAO reductase YedYZ molybdopterin-dependent catalytic subunit
MKNTLILILILIAASVSAQDAVTVEGEVTKPLKITVAEMQKFPVNEVTAKDRDGKDHVYKGTLLSNVLATAGVTLGKDLRGENLVKYVIVKAIDGYEVIYSLAEIDPEFSSGIVLLATHVDGNSLSSSEGPFRLVAPLDKRPARWIRQITGIKVMYSKE